LVLLGASNLARGLPTLLAAARRAFGEPLDVVAASGRGRSYGQSTRMLGRALPGILGSGLWRDWEGRPELPTSALVTDVGNDIMYGVPPDELLGWVATVLERLRRAGSATIVTTLPRATLEGLGPRRYKVLRSLFFPRNRDVYELTLRRAETVDAGLRRLATEHAAELVEPPPIWYGFDAIHIRRSQWSTAWGALVAAWRPPREVPRVAVAPWTWVAAQLWRPDERRLLGRRQVRAQPSVEYADGTRVSLF
jgi:hypothetical protein